MDEDNGMFCSKEAAEEESIVRARIRDAEDNAVKETIKWIVLGLVCITVFCLIILLDEGIL